MCSFRWTWPGVLLLAACSAPLDCPEGTEEDGGSRRCVPTTVEGLNTLCDLRGASPALFEVIRFADNPPGCPWGEGDNLTETQLEVTARVELRVSTEITADVGCFMDLDFTNSRGLVDDVVYDDGFFLLFGDVVVASSHSSLVERLAESGRFSRLWDWSRVAGEVIPFTNVSPYCIGVAEGFGTCTVTEPDTAGPITIDPDIEVQRELLFRARETGNGDFTFITFSDNDADSDCRSDEYLFTVDFGVLPGGGLSGP